MMEKLSFFRESRHAFGRSALMFSGGGTLGMFHLGILKSLIENNLLPRILSGSSVGSIFASICGSKTDSKILDLANGNINLEFFHKKEKPESLFFRIKRFLKTGQFFDMHHLQSVLKTLFGNMTFQEAYDRTGRIVNITVSPATGNFNQFMLLNYLTAPNVLLWSACSASCAIPVIFHSVQLMEKNAFDEIVPYHTKGVTWVDGTFMSDLPMQKLSELFNVNHFIVSQVNPHIIAVAYTSARISIGLIPNLIRLIFNCWRGIFSNILQSGPPHLRIFLPLRLIAPLMTQIYRGHITYIPSGWKWRDFWHILSNPTLEEMKMKRRISEIESYALHPTILANCSIEFALDKCIRNIQYILNQNQDDDQCLQSRKINNPRRPPTTMKYSNSYSVKSKMDRVTSFVMTRSLSQNLRHIASQSSLNEQGTEEGSSESILDTKLYKLLDI